VLSPRWMLIVRDLWNNRSRTLLVILSIAVGVFAVGVIMTTATVVSREMTESYMEISPASSTVWSWGVDEDMIHTLKKAPGVQEAEGRCHFSLKAQDAAGDWKPLALYALADYDNIRLGKIWPEEGAWPPPKHQVLVERTVLQVLDKEIGDTLVIEVYDGKQREMIIAGTVHDLNMTPAPLSGNAYGYVSRDSLEWLGLSEAYSQIAIKTTPDHHTVEQINAVAQQVQEKLEKSGYGAWGYWTPEPGKHPADEIISPILVLLGFLGAMALALSGFLVINTITAILTQHIRYIGIMKTVGGRKRQITAIYVRMVLVFGLLSLLIAIPLGVVVASQFTQYLGRVVNFDVARFALPSEVLAVEVVIGLLVPVLTGLVPIVMGTRVTAHKAMSAYGLAEHKVRRGPLDRLLERIRGLPRPLMLSLRNTFRRKARLTLTLATLTLGGAIFCGVLSAHASMMHTLDEALQYWNSDVNIDFRRPHRIEKLEREAARMPSIAAAESWSFYGAYPLHEDGSQGEQVLMVAPPPHTTMINPLLVEGRWLLPEDQNAVVVNTEVLKQEPDIQVGDDLLLELDKGDTRVERTWHVVGIVRGVMTGPMVYANQEVLMRAMGRVGRAYSLRIQLADPDPTHHKAIARQLEDDFNRAGLRVRRWHLMSDSREQVAKQLNIIIVLLLSMAVLLAIVGGLGLMGTMSINVLERTREVGVMRAIGATSKSVLRIVITEGLIVAAISWLLGAALAWPLSRSLNAIVGQSILQTSLTHVFSYGGTGLWLVIVLFLAALASMLPARRASRVTVRDVLSYE